MNDKNVFLSICIPTFNREPYLRKSLSELLPQLQGRSLEDVEVLVSDNCSTDNTEAVVTEAVEKYNVPISYSRNEKNIGGNNNMAKVISRSSGQYVYIMGDDDVLSPDFINIIFRLLKTGDDISLIHWNRLSGDSNCSNNYLYDRIYDTPCEIGSFDKFIRRVLERGSLISSILFNRVCWDKGEPYDKKDYFGYNWYGRILFGAALHNKKCIYYYFPLIIQCIQSHSWAKYWPQYIISSMSNIFYDLDPIVPGVYDQWLKKLKTKIPTELPSIGGFRSYYRQKDIKVSIFKHLNKWEKIKYNYYVIPGTYKIYRIKMVIKKKLLKVLG